MSRIIPEPKIYKHQQLMHDFNELQVRIKTYLFDIGDSEFKSKHPKPTPKELDEMMEKVMEVLKQDSKSFKVH